ncbi:MAG TPA: hypothetical protein PKD37_01695 [Oligoflexia bacterium]|nr:hypothetical protein [Oligoflexia bacterium]HMP26690.1 hypothetical protein [Oligoflexia bacterium]
MHIDPSKIKYEEIIKKLPLPFTAGGKALPIVLVLVGCLSAFYGLSFGNPQHFWASYYTNVIFWMGLAVGGVIISCIFQIVRAEWSPPVRRITEATSAFLPAIFFLWALSFFGKEYLFPWATSASPGKEWWMKPLFVYGRFFLILGGLFYLMSRFVRLSLRGDLGLLREESPEKIFWNSSRYDRLVKNWRGAQVEIPLLQKKLSWNAPLIIALFAFLYSLFAFEMIMSLDPVWYSNMFGGFICVSGIYLAWAVTSITCSNLSRDFKDYDGVIGRQQFWDLGKLTFGFGILWAYLFFSQFLPQWYGNLPEETQWMILRTREWPWKGLGWATLASCFIIPFIVLLSRDVKKNRVTLKLICVLIVVGLWLAKYVIVMPHFFAEEIPFGVVEVGLFLGFLGVYSYCVRSFLSRYPYVPLSHPLTWGQTKW